MCRHIIKNSFPSEGKVLTINYKNIKEKSSSDKEKDIEVVDCNYYYYYYNLVLVV